MVTDAKGQQWCMVLVTRQDGTAFLDIVPGCEDLTVLAVFAWAAFPAARTIDYQGTALVRPWRDGALERTK